MHLLYKNMRLKKYHSPTYTRYVTFSSGINSINSSSILHSDWDGINNFTKLVFNVSQESYRGN